ncbi:MAG: hypothetical protein PVG39_04715 [Desulfobacteraceae bacterium]|jgi:hypothetical protein
MKKFFTILAISAFMLVALPAFMPNNTNIDTAYAAEKEGAGWYEFIDEKTDKGTGRVKWFDSHPVAQSQWRYLGDEYDDPETPPPSYTPACVGDCPNGGCFKGEFEQSTGAWKDAGNVTIEDDTITVKNGAFASSMQTGGGSYEGELFECPYCDSWGLGLVGSFGGSYAYAENDDFMAKSIALTGNITAGVLIGDKLRASCLRIYGDGSHVTLALKRGLLAGEWSVLGFANTSGQFDYNASTSLPNSVLLGAGLTGGLSKVNLTDNSVTALAGGFTGSGVGRFRLTTNN